MYSLECVVNRGELRLRAHALCSAQSRVDQTIAQSLVFAQSPRFEANPLSRSGTSSGKQARAVGCVALSVEHYICVCTRCSVPIAHK